MTPPAYKYLEKSNQDPYIELNIKKLEKSSFWKTLIKGWFRIFKNYEKYQDLLECKKSWPIQVPYERHYNPRFVYFLPHILLRFI